MKKKDSKVGIEFSINENTKSHQIYIYPQFLACNKKLVEFTDSAHIIY